MYLLSSSREPFEIMRLFLDVFWQVDSTPEISEINAFTERKRMATKFSQESTGDVFIKPELKHNLVDYKTGASHWSG